MASVKSKPSYQDPVVEIHSDEKALVEKFIFKQLGRPTNLHKLVVHKVGNHNYRVNVITEKFVEGETCTIKRLMIAHSYYITEKSDGYTSSPEINKIY